MPARCEQHKKKLAIATKRFLHYEKSADFLENCATTGTVS